MLHSTPLLRKDGLYLAHTETKGRGLFCSHAITAGEELEVTPAIILTEDETLDTDKTILRDYVFRIGDLSQEALDNLGIKDAELASCVVMGIASYCNHDEVPNAQVMWEEIEGSLYYTLVALTDIPADIEICTSYGDNWFSSR